MNFNVSETNFEVNVQDFNVNFQNDSPISVTKVLIFDNFFLTF